MAFDLLICNFFPGKQGWPDPVGPSGKRHGQLHTIGKYPTLPAKESNCETGRMWGSRNSIVYARECSFVVKLLLRKSNILPAIRIVPHIRIQRTVMTAIIPCVSSYWITSHGISIASKAATIFSMICSRCLGDINSTSYM
jgi:hypothetical protein